MSIPARILVVDDEPAIRRLLHGVLGRASYGVIDAATGREALALATSADPDIILLDLGLPDRDGLELLPLLKRAGRAAVLVVSAREATDEKVAALDLGADDYVTKPFDGEELLARIRTALRNRVQAGGARPLVVAGAVEINLVDRLVRRDGAEVHLTRKEYDVLAELARAPGRVITHQQILRAAWPTDHERHIEYLRLVVRNLRQKIEPDPGRPAILLNELGVGYRLADGQR